MLQASGKGVAITGMGILSCLGRTLEEVSACLREGKSGIIVDESRRANGFRSALAGRPPCLNGARFSRKMLRTMCQPAQYAYAATVQAVLDAGLDDELLQSGRCGIVFGNDSCVKSAVEAIDIARDSGETHFIGSGYIFRSMNSTVTMNLATSLGIKGASWTLSAACTSGAHAVGQALMLIRSGLQDIVIVGGAQETNWESMASFDALGVFSTRHDDPAGACRPFDVDRDGLVPSGGAACLVLESPDHAASRGARVYGVVRGYGFSCEGGENLSQTTEEGVRRAISNALQDGGVGPDDVEYINAHATGTLGGDPVEARGIASVFGPTVPVSSTKSLTGHECWMAGASEVVYTTLMARDGFIAPNLNFSRLDDDCPQINVVPETRETRIGMAISNSFGFGGTNAAILLDYGEC